VEEALEASVNVRVLAALVTKFANQLRAAIEAIAFVRVAVIRLAGFKVGHRTSFAPGH
jgi:hypothetical protein